MKTRGAQRHRSTTNTPQPRIVVVEKSKKSCSQQSEKSDVLVCSLTDDGTLVWSSRYPPTRYAHDDKSNREGNTTHIRKRRTTPWVWSVLMTMYHKLWTVLSLCSVAFLPSGYPSSVTPDYLPYQLWDTVQGLCSYISGMAASQATLQGIGVGNAAATPAAAILTFLFKDMAGLLTNVVFASLYSRSFDAYPKQWRFLADVTNDIGLLIELAAPLLPSLFLPLACFGAMCRSVTGVAGGATRMALTQHFALHGNAADISAKEGSQETAVTLLGMILGLGLTRLFSTWKAVAWLSVLSLTFIHVYANMKALRALCLTKLNASRLDAILDAYVVGFSDKNALSRCPSLPSPKDIALTEPLTPPPLQALLFTGPSRIEFGSLRRMSQKERACFVKTLQLLLQMQDSSGVAVVSKPLLTGMLVKDTMCIMWTSPHKAFLFLGTKVMGNADVYVQAYCLARLLEKGVPSSHIKDWGLGGQAWLQFKAALSMAGWRIDDSTGLMVPEETGLEWNGGGG